MYSKYFIPVCFFTITRLWSCSSSTSQQAVYSIDEKTFISPDSMYYMVVVVASLFNNKRGHHTRPQRDESKKDSVIDTG
jgi:hypothetical protein